MSLKIYTNSEIQDYLKNDSGDLLLGIQIAQSEWLQTIYEAIPIIGLPIASIELQKIDINKNIISSESLPTNLISYDSGSNQYLIDRTKDVSFSEGTYQIEFLNIDNQVFLSEPFLVDSDVNTPWILADGIWDNKGIWNNSKIWQTI